MTSISETNNYFCLSFNFTFIHIFAFGNYVILFINKTSIETILIKMQKYNLPEQQRDGQIPMFSSNVTCTSTAAIQAQENASVARASLGVVDGYYGVQVVICCYVYSSHGLVSSSLIEDDISLCNNYERFCPFALSIL